MHDPMLQAQLKDWIPMTAIILGAAWMLYLVTISIRKKHQSEMQKALLEKFSSAHDFAEFMQSPAGQKYVMSFADAVTSPRSAIMKSIQTGIVMLFAGSGLLASGQSFTAGQRDQLWFLGVLGNFVLCVGAGFLVSAAVSYFMAKKIDAGVKE